MTKAGIKFLMQMHNETMAFITSMLKLLLNEIKVSTSMHCLCCQEMVKGRTMKQGLEFYSGHRKIACIGQIERAVALEGTACICSIEHGCGCSC